MTMKELELKLNGQVINEACGLCWNEKTSCDCEEYNTESDPFITLNEELQYA